MDFPPRWWQTAARMGAEGWEQAQGAGCKRRSPELFRSARSFDADGNFNRNATTLHQHTSFVTTMKTKTYNLLRHPAALALASAALLAAPSVLCAADDIVLDTFDTADTASGWSRWWGAAAQTYEWDGTMDADGSATSGSLKVTVQFDLATHGGDNQFAALRTFSLLPGSQYTNLVFDLLWDPNSPQRAAGDFGYMEPGFRNQDFSQNWLPGFAVSTNPGWMRITLPINPNAPNIDTINGVVLKMWSGQAPGGFTGPAIFWVDNVKLIARPSDVEDPPPTLLIEKPAPGLKIFASAAGSQYQRQNVRTASPSYSWVGAAEPVKYSITIGDYPSSTYSGFQTHLFIVPGTDIPTFETSPDYNRPNVVFLDIQNQANGGAFANFRYKTNLPSGNSMIYGAGTIAGIGSTTIRGTWDLVFDPSGTITLTTPNGTSTNFSMPPEAVALFSGPAYAYFGIQPNQLTSIGQSATLARIQITSVSVPIDDSFPGPLDTATWQVIAENPAGVTTIPPDAAFWLSWNLPDRDFVPEVIEDLGSGFATWADFPLTATQIGDRRRAVVLTSQLPINFTGNYFFRLVKRPPAAQ